MHGDFRVADNLCGEEREERPGKSQGGLMGTGPRSASKQSNGVHTRVHIIVVLMISALNVLLLSTDFGKGKRMCVLNSYQFGILPLSQNNFLWYDKQLQTFSETKELVIIS